MVTVISDPRCLRHRPPGQYPECPERLEGLLDHLRRDGGRKLVMGVAHAGAREAVTALHAAPYVERFERAVARGDALLDSADNPLSPGTGEAAWAAVEVALTAADRLMEGHPERAPSEAVLAAVRPPGHHAEEAMAMGFCFFNNVAVAADYLVRIHGLERVAIFDFDVHHGNGTQHLFAARRDVFFASTHQFPFYPGTGAAGERGVGVGEGFTLNIPLAAGGGDEVYAQALEEKILPALREAQPQALLISAGFDAWQHDPLAGMRVSEEGYESWGRSLGELAAELCQGRVLSMLEGGYDLSALPRLVSAYLKGLEEGLATSPTGAA